MSWRRHLLLFVVLVPLLNTLAVLVLPEAINTYVMHRIVKQALAEAALASDDPAIRRHKALILERGAINVALPAQRADANARTVVRPSPDLLYTACVFDLSRGPLHVSAALPDSYMSISGFAADTSNFFAINDRDVSVDLNGQRGLDLWITHGAITVPHGATQTIASPSKRGLVLFRTLVQDRVADSALLQLRSMQTCEPATRSRGG